MECLFRNSISMMEKSMNYLWAKQAAILDNISNAETPGYKAKVVTFEEGFRKQLEKARCASTPRHAVRSAIEVAEISVAEPDAALRMDDNSVNITEQSVELVRNAYQLQYVMQSINSELTILRKAIGG